jgi:hypothetical protein
MRMIDDSILDEMDLPLTNANEELETISKNLLLPLFDVKKFEIRPEDVKDKGIDLHVELKRSNKNLNFRLVIQLKATESKKFNSDGSISMQLHTSNINYLLNNSMPAFYILYAKSTNTFYYENLNEFAKSLYEKDAEWQKQKSHSLRFNKVLTQDAISSIYDYTIQKGLFNKKINEKLILKSASLNATDKILVDKESTIWDDAEIRTNIEVIGFMLINEGKWKEIIQVHKNGSGSVASTAKYNLILGIANYYNGNLLDALSFLKSAVKLQAELPADLVNHLAYFDTSVKSALGLITDTQYQQRMGELEGADNVGLYIRLEKAKNNYYQDLSTNQNERFNQLVSEFAGIINDPGADAGIKLNARCELILIEGSKNNLDHVKRTAMINALENPSGPDPKRRAESGKQFVESNSSWFKKVLDLESECLESKNYFYYFNTVINEVKVKYEMLVVTSLVAIEQTAPGLKASTNPDIKQVFDDLLDKIEKTLGYYRQIGHAENEVVALSAKYEILHYLGDLPNANAALNEAETLIDTYELTEKKRKLEHLKAEGATHQKFKSWMDGIFAEAEKNKNEVEGLVAEMMKMDENERKEKSPAKDCLHIQLIPIGLFAFPEAQKEKIYQLLNISRPETRKTFDNLFSFAIPVANIYYSEIVQEGPLNGVLADKGIESWRNIYKIRKALYDNKFYRDETTQ